MYRTLAAALAVVVQGVPPMDVSSVVISQTRIVCQLDMSVLKGEVRRLTWSTEGTRLHLQTLDRAESRDYIVTLPDGAISRAFGEPEWAAEYWTHKSQLAAPGQPDLKIEVIEDHQRTRPVPFSGGFMANGAQTVDQRNPVDTFAVETKLKLLGQEVGYFLNDVALAGMSYGWGPSGSGAIVFVDDKGRVVLFDRNKHKQIVPGTKDALLPAWSNDGARVAFLEKDGRRSYHLMVSTVTR
jgi:hypothetical protein